MPQTTVPDWVPSDAARYLAHIEGGLPIRELARHAGCHASTVLRQIRRLENRRDDTLVDEALRHLGRALFRSGQPQPDKDRSSMTNQTSLSDLPPDDRTLRAEALRILRPLNDPGAVLAVATDMENAVVVRQDPGGDTRGAVVARAVAQALALKGWIACDNPGRVSRYVITAAGRTELQRLIAQAGARAGGFAEGAAQFLGAAPLRAFDGPGDPDTPRRRRIRYSPADSPLIVLARRKDRDGQPFLSDDLVQAGERLREDFELAQMGPRVAQNWDRFLTAGADRGGFAETGPDRGPAAARDRVAAALRALGPGLGDVALRCCCYLEGLEVAEKRMGWSARSGKIVLRIALERLRAHYDRTGSENRLIG